MLTQSAQALLDLARSPTASDAEVEAGSRQLLALSDRAPLVERSQALRILSQSLHLPDPARAAVLALLCGALLENGADPAGLAGPLTERLQGMLQSSITLAEAARAHLAAEEERAEDEADEAVDQEGDDEGTEDESGFEELCRAVAPSMPREALEWGALKVLWRPAVALYSRDPAARAAAQPLRPLAEALVEIHEAGYWLNMLFRVLHEEPILVLEPSTGLGIIGKFSGIVENFQLHTILMDIFPRTGFHLGGRVSKRVAQVARGIGPQQTNDTVIGVWNLYNWPALRPDLTLPGMEDGATHWIWGEGNPEDIATFEGHRVVLLGPPSYQRSWQSQRMFAGLPADLTVERKLNKEEVRQWLQRLAAAPR